jgi:hypothetical protein
MNYEDLVAGNGCAAYEELHLFRDAALKEVFSDVKKRAADDPMSGLTVGVNNHLLPVGGEMITVSNSPNLLLTYSTSDELPSAHTCVDLAKKIP